MGLVNSLDSQVSKNFFCGWIKVYLKFKAVTIVPYSSEFSHKLTVVEIKISLGNSDTLERQQNL